MESYTAASYKGASPNPASVLDPQANLANNPNMFGKPNKDGGRDPLAALLAKAGMLNRARDLVDRANSPEKNKGEPLTQDPEANLFIYSAENRPHERNKLSNMTEYTKKTVEGDTKESKSPTNLPKDKKRAADDYNLYSPYGTKYGKENKTKGIYAAFKKIGGGISEYSIKPVIEVFKKLRQSYTKKEYEPEFKQDSKNPHSSLTSKNFSYLIRKTEKYLKKEGYKGGGIESRRGYEDLLPLLLYQKEDAYPTIKELSFQASDDYGIEARTIANLKPEIRESGLEQKLAA